MDSSLVQPTSSLEMVTSAHFGHWLHEQQISFSFTTYQTNRLFCIGTSSEGVITAQEQLFDKPMGLYAAGDRLYMSTRYQIWQLDNLLDDGEGRQGCDGQRHARWGDRLYSPKTAHTTGDLNVHDVVLNAAGDLLFINTDFSCLSRLSPDYSFEPLWTPPFISKLVAEDRCHLNGLAMREGQPAYVTACSTTNTAAGWRDHRVKGGVVVDVQSNEIIATGLSMPHSPRWYQGKLWLLNSGSGELGYVDAQRSVFVPLTFCPGFVRGLAFWQNFALVGLSKLRSRSFSGLALEERLAAIGQQPQCGLMVIDLTTGDIVHWLHLEGVVEELFDVVVLPGVQRPQVMGFQSEDIERLVTFPGSGGIVTTKPTVKRPSIGNTAPIAGLPREPHAPSSPPLSIPSSSPPSVSTSSPKFQKVFHLNAENLAPYDPFTCPSLQQRWQTQPQRGELLGTSASIDGEMVAFAIAEILPDSTGELISLFVAPEYRQQGIATRLIALLERTVQTEGCTQLSVEYESTSLTAIALEPLLRKLGWTKPETAFGKRRSHKCYTANSAIKISPPIAPLPLSNAKPRVSLVMTVYNTEAYLAEALDSVLAQTFLDWELILWDDGSTDSSLAIAQSYAQRDSRIRVQAGIHAGQGKSQHQAHQLTRGEYVGWVDADDQLAPTALEETVAFLDHYPDYGMVYTNYVDMDIDGNPLGLGHRCQIPYTPNRLLVDLVTFHFRLIRTTVYGAVGGVNTEIGIAEDYDLCLRIEEVTRIYHLERPLYYYRINPQGLSQQRYEFQKQVCVQAINQALERRGLASAYVQISDPETGACRIQQRESISDEEAAKAQFEAGKRFAQRGNPDGAIACFRKAIRLQPDYVAAYNQLGNALQRIGEIEKAIAAYQQVLAIDPRIAPAHCNLGIIWQMQGKIDAAIAAYQQAIALKPDFVLAHLNLGRLYVNKMDWRKAESCFRNAVHLQPDTATVYLELANTLRQQGKIKKAIAPLHQALKLQPDLVEAWHTLGCLWMTLGEMPKAQHCFEQVLSLQPDYPQVDINLGHVLKVQGQLTEALAIYGRSLERDPENTEILYQFEHVRLTLCDWDSYDQRMYRLQARLQQHLADETARPLLPLLLNSFPVAMPLHTQVARRWAQQVSLSIQTLKQHCTFSSPSPPSPKLRVGYLSADFRLHAVGTLIHQIFKYHDRSRFEIYAYALLNAEDEFTAAVRQGCDEFVDLSDLAPEAAARRIHADGIHILIDLAGYTTFSRPEILALQPAPIQMQYLGHPDTMGADFIQYILADRWLVPPQLREYYAENVIELPYAFTTSPLDISGQPVARLEVGLPEDAFVFCCFNRSEKVDPHVFATWMRILQQVPDSVLWLIETSSIVSDRLRTAAQHQGIAPERICFTPRMPFAQYLTAYRLADLFLDTWIYNAGATAIHALWMGLPLLTYPGEAFTARMGASICAAAGLEQLICDSPAMYEQQAVHLATHPEALITLRQHLEVRRDDLPLFQPQHWIAHLESTYWQLWHQIHE